MANAPRTIADLERKYNFSSLLGLNKNMKMNEKSITEVQNQLANMLNTLIINLRDVLDSQSDISLWFFNGIPTMENKPYIMWNTPAEHYGDIYYDQETGYVYQYNQDGWIKNTDTNLVQAMALTNTELDITEDHERKIYFEQPLPPYSSGDWWILQDGTLKICQLGRTTGNYDTEDFIIANRYLPTIATTDGDIITIKHGQVIKMSDTFASFEDLATGGKTTINGANIRTGNINTDNVTIGNGNCVLDDEGLKLKNGAKVIGTNGLMNTYIFSNKQFSFCGYYIADYLSSTRITYSIPIDVVIPQGLKVTKAQAIIYHSPVYWGYPDVNFVNHNVWGYCRNIKIYKATNTLSRLMEAQIGSEYDLTNNTNYSEISGALGSNGWTPSVPSNISHNTEKYTSSDFHDIFKDAGLYEILVKPSENINTSWNCKDGCERSRNCLCRVNYRWLYVILKRRNSIC